MIDRLLAAYRGQNVLVTGITGFKGAWLSIWLQRLGASVSGLALPPADGEQNLFEVAQLADRFRCTMGDIRDPDVVQRALEATAPRIVFHLAAQSLVRASYVDPVGTFSTNVMGTAHVLDAVRASRRPAAVIVVSSDKCYENREQPSGYVETDRMGGHDPYSASKGCTELVTASYRRSFFPPDALTSHQVAVASGRAGNVIGPGDWSKDRIIPDAIRALQRRVPIEVRNPSSIRPWQHVLESLSGYLTLGERLMGADAGACSAFNFGPRDEDACTVRVLMEELISIWGSGSWRDASDPNAPHEAGLLRLDPSKALRVLGWRPRWTVSEALAQTVDGYQRLSECRGPGAVDVLLGQISAYERALMADHAAVA